VFEGAWRKFCIEKFHDLIVFDKFYKADQSKEVEINEACNIGDGHGKGGACKMRDGGEMDGTSDVSDTDCKFLQNCCQKL
jgi:hypothetical protein